MCLKMYWQNIVKKRQNFAIHRKFNPYLSNHMRTQRPCLSKISSLTVTKGNYIQRAMVVVEFQENAQITSQSKSIKKRRVLQYRKKGCMDVKECWKKRFIYQNFQTTSRCLQILAYCCCCRNIAFFVEYASFRVLQISTRYQGCP